MPTALELYHDTWEEFVKAKLSKQHQVAKFVSDMGKSALGIKRWKEAAVKVPAEGLKKALSFGASALPGPVGEVVGMLTDPVVDTVTDKLIEKWMAHDSEKTAKTDLKVAFSHKAAKKGLDALEDLPKHVAQLAEAHKTFYDTIEAFAKVQGKDADELKQMVIKLYASFHALRWAHVKVARDAGVIKKLVEKLDALLDKNQDWFSKTGAGMIQLTAKML